MRVRESWRQWRAALPFERKELMKQTCRNVSVSDSHTHAHKHVQSLVNLPANLGSCNYSRGSVPETLEGRAALWFDTWAWDVLCSSENQLAGNRHHTAQQTRDRQRPLLIDTQNDTFWMHFSAGFQGVQWFSKQLIRGWLWLQKWMKEQSVVLKKYRDLSEKISPLISWHADRFGVICSGFVFCCNLFWLI